MTELVDFPYRRNEQGKMVIGATEDFHLWNLWNLVREGVEVDPAFDEIRINAVGNCYLIILNSETPGYWSNGIRYTQLQELPR